MVHYTKARLIAWTVENHNLYEWAKGIRDVNESGPKLELEYGSNSVWA